MKLTESRERAQDILDKYCPNESVVHPFIKQEIFESCEKEADEKMELLVKGWIEEIENFTDHTPTGNIIKIYLDGKWWQALKDKILKEIGSGK